MRGGLRDLCGMTKDCAEWLEGKDCGFHHLDEDTQEALEKKPTSAEERVARDEALKKKADYIKRLLEWKRALTSARLEREPYDSELD